MAEHKDPFMGPELRFQCDKCEQGFRAMTSLVIHKSLMHTSNGNCPETQKPFKGPTDTSFTSKLEKHMVFIQEPLNKPKTIHPENQLGLQTKKDHKPLANLKSSYRLRMHQLVHNGENFQCKQCGKVFKCGSSLGSHMLDTHWFVIERTTEAGVMVKTNRRSLPAECNLILVKGVSSSSKKPDSLAEEIPGTEAGIQKMEARKIRVLSSNSKNKTLEIIQKEEASGPIPIEQTKPIVQPGRRKQKIVVRVEEPELILMKDTSVLPTNGPTATTSTLDKKYLCQICGKRYTSHSNLNGHMIYHQEPRYKCPNCPKSFHRESNAQLHMNSFHLRQTNFKSSYCDRVFLYSSSRARHDKSHREKGVCWKGLKTYEGHSQKHTPNSSNSHACNICGKIFIRMCRLKMHELTHSDAKNFHCEHCGKVFKCGTKLYAHVRKAHPNRRISEPNDNENENEDKEWSDENRGIDAIYYPEVKMEYEELIPPEEIKIEFPEYEYKDWIDNDNTEDSDAIYFPELNMEDVEVALTALIPPEG